MTMWHATDESFHKNPNALFARHFVARKVFRNLDRMAVRASKFYNPSKATRCRSRRTCCLLAV